MFYMKAYPERSDLNHGVFFELEGRRRRDGEGEVCVCVCGGGGGHVYVVYEDTNLYNDMGMTRAI